MIKWFKASLSDESPRKYYYACYTAVFLIVALFVYLWPLVLGKSLIQSGDGWNQHYKALLYYSGYLRKIIRTLIYEHRIVIPDWDFYIGEGSDIINTLHYYVIGDLFALLSVFFPARFVRYYYSLSCVMRLYFSGISFSLLAFETDIKSRYGILAGAVSYSFCFWAVINSVKHIYFLNPLVFFPLIILGIEKIIHNKRPYLFIISVALSAASNFYFFYMIVVLTAVYVLLRLLFLYYRSIKNGLIILGKIAFYSTTGVCISGVLFIPVLLMFCNDSRLSNSQPFHLFYPLGYYSSIPSILLTSTSSFWLCMGYSTLVIIALFSLFSRKKQDTFLKLLCATGGVIMLFPIFGRVLNGMSYATNRWSWGMALLCAYILAREWNYLLSLNDGSMKRIMICCVLLYFITLFLLKSRTMLSFSSIALLFITVIVLKEKNTDYGGLFRKQMILLLITCFSVSSLGFFFLSPEDEKEFLSQLVEYRRIDQMAEDNDAVIIKQIAEEAYPRYSGRDISQNHNMIEQVSSTQYYWTMSNPYLNQYRRDIEVGTQSFYHFRDYDDRTVPLALSAVDYYVFRDYDTDGLPYGYSLLRTFEGGEEMNEHTYSVYKNDHPLSLGYCYEAYIDDNTYNSLDAVQKQEVQLAAAYIKDPPEDLPLFPESIPDFSIPYRLECNGNDITRSEDGFVTTDNKTTVTLTFNGKKDSETYIRFEGLDFRLTPEYDLYSDNEKTDPLNIYNKTDWELLSRDDQLSVLKKNLYWSGNMGDSGISFKIESSSGMVKGLYYRPEEASRSNDRHDFIVNLGYQEEPVTSITITFPSRGVYTVKNLQVFCVPMDGYSAKIEKLRENTLQNISLDTDSVSGDITLDKAMVLVMSIPFSTGWKAYIDGNETSVMTANERHLGVLVPQGYHEILFTYSTPYKHLGMMVSLAGIIVLILVMFFTERAKRFPN